MKILVRVLSLFFFWSRTPCQGAVPPDQSMHEIVACYARNLAPGCPRGSVLAVTSFHYGFKDASLNCTSDGTAKGDCCVYDNKTDCLQEAPSKSTYVNVFSGKNEGFIPTKKKPPVKGGACDSPSYSPLSVFGRLTFTCIEETRIHSVCTPVAVKSSKPIYLQNRNYPNGIPAKDNGCTCSVDTTFRSDIELYTVHVDLLNTTIGCSQNITVTNADGHILKTFLCEKDFNVVKNETIPTNYVVVSLQNTLILGDLGKFWLGFKGTSSEVGDEVVVNCPAKPPIDCGRPPLITNGQVTSSSTRFGGTAVYVCDTGYERTTGSDVMSCMSNGEWNGSLPLCSPVECGTPTEIANGRLSYNLTSFGHNVTYTCNKGYGIETSGSDVRVCQSTGIWTGKTPKCLFVVQASRPALLVYVGIIISVVIAVGTVVVVVVMYIRRKAQSRRGVLNGTSDVQRRMRRVVIETVSDRGQGAPHC